MEEGGKERRRNSGGRKRAFHSVNKGKMTRRNRRMARRKRRIGRRRGRERRVGGGEEEMGRTCLKRKDDHDENEYKTK